MVRSDETSGGRMLENTDPIAGLAVRTVARDRMPPTHTMSDHKGLISSAVG